MTRTIRQGFCWLLFAGLFATASSERCRAQSAQPKSKGDVLLGERPGQVRSDNRLKMKLVWCPPGEFTMGSPKDERGRGSDEGPAKVTLTHGFWLGQLEVTQAEWKAVMQTEPWKGKDNVREGADFPASYVRHQDAMDFAQRLTNLERTARRLPKDWHYALPTEAQWEYACRAGATTRFSFGDDEAMLSDYAWWGTDQGNTRQEKYAHAVGTRKPNAWGLHDMHGNVYEWCQDAYEPDLPGGVDPFVSAEHTTRVYKGGDWSAFDHAFYRTANRGRGPASGRGNDLGFRVSLQPIVAAPKPQ